MWRPLIALLNCRALETRWTSGIKRCQIVNAFFQHPRWHRIRGALLVWQWLNGDDDVRSSQRSKLRQLTVWRCRRVCRWVGIRRRSSHISDLAVHGRRRGTPWHYWVRRWDSLAAHQWVDGSPQFARSGAFSLDLLRPDVFTLLLRQDVINPTSGRPRDLVGWKTGTTCCTFSRRTTRLKTQSSSSNDGSEGRRRYLTIFWGKRSSRIAATSVSS